MPRKPARPCRQAGCPNLTEHRSGWCDDHRADHMWQRRKGAAEKTTARGYGYRWRKLRDAVLAARPLCKMCDDRGRVTLATEVDHIVPKAKGGTDAWDNLQPLCSDCHREKTNKEKNQ